MGFFEDWDRITESTNNDVFDWVKTKVSEHIERFLNDKATKRDLETLIGKCDGFLRDQYGQKTYYDSLERYVHNGRIRHDIGDYFITSGFYSTLISIFVYCDDCCRGEENFANYHLNKMQDLFPTEKFDKNDVKMFFLRCYKAFKEEFAIPSSEDRAIVDALKETTANEGYLTRQVIRDENRCTQDMIEHGFNEMRNQISGINSEEGSVQDPTEMRIHDNNEEYRELYQDTLFLEAELGDHKKATLEDTYVNPYITSTVYPSFDLEKWICDRDSRILLLYGKAGIGKTSFVSWLAFKHWSESDCHILKLRDYIGKLNSEEPWRSIKECFKCENDSFYENAVLILDGLDEVCVLNREFDGHKFVENLSRILKTKIGRHIRVILTSRMGYFNEVVRDLHIEKAIITWNETSVNRWCDSYGKIHTNRMGWCNCFKKKYFALNTQDKRKEVFCSPIILYICCVSRINIFKHSSVASIYDEAFRVIGKKEYHIMKEETENEVEISRQFTKEIAFQMFLNEKLDGVLESDWVNIAKEKTLQWGQERYGNEEIKLEFKKLFTLNHFAFNNANAVEFAHKTVGEYFTAIKFYEDYFKFVFDVMEGENLKDISLALTREVWRSIFKAFRYKEIPPDIMTYLADLIRSKQSKNWEQKFFKCYYMGLTEQFLVVVANVEPKYKATYHVLIKQIQLAFRNLTWMLTMLGFENYEFNNSKENLAILSSYLEGDVCLDGWKNLEGIDLSMKNLEGASFSRCSLNTSVFKCSKLSTSTFWRTILNDTDFSEAHLENSGLEEAQLERANFQGAHLGGARLIEAHLENAKFFCADLQGADLQKSHSEEAQFPNSYFEGAQLQSAHFEKAQFQNARFEDSNLKGAHFEEAQFQSAHFERADLRKTFFTKANLEHAHLEFAHLEASHFEDACLNNVSLGETVFEMTHLEQASLENVCLVDDVPVDLIFVYLLESDLPKFDKYIQSGAITIVNPIVATDDDRKVYNPETNRMEIKEE